MGRGGGGLHLSSSSWVGDGCCADINDGGRWSSGVMEESGHAGDRGGMDRGVELAARQHD
jgi:hypothetical protein